MTLSVDVTVGGASSNSYCSVAEGDSYHEGHLYATDWSNAATTVKEASLVMATRILDDYVRWRGVKNKNSQALEWPRYSVWDENGYLLDNTALPQFLKDATAEMARHLIGSNRTAETGLEGFKVLEVKPIHIEPDKSDRAEVIPAIVWSMISYFGWSRRARRTLVRA